MTDPSTTRAPGLTTVLLAVEDAEASIGAIRVATDLAVQTHAELIVISVLPVTEGYGLMGLDARAVEEDRAVSMVERVANDAIAAGAQARAVTTRGRNAADVIVKAARDLKADVIVVGRKGRSDLARAMLGDTTARVIGAAASPVLVVPRAAKFSRKRILLATDGSAASERAGRTATLCAKIIELPVTVMSVDAPDKASSEAATIAERTALFMRERGVDATTQVARGVPPDEVVAAAAELGADLIVVGSAGRSGLDRVMLGSNCQAIIGKSVCPVLVATAQMVEYQSPKTRPPTHTEATAAHVALPRRTFLVVIDDTEEVQVAIDYACRRAHATGGQVTLLNVVPPDAPGSTKAKPTAEAAALAHLARVATDIERMLGEKPVTFLRVGSVAQEVLDLLQAEPGINALVLAASADPRGPGPLITDLVTKHAAALPVPLMIVPGHAGRRLA